MIAPRGISISEPPARLVAIFPSSCPLPQGEGRMRGNGRTYAQAAYILRCSPRERTPCASPPFPPRLWRMADRACRHGESNLLSGGNILLVLLGRAHLG